MTLLFVKNMLQVQDMYMYLSEFLLSKVDDYTFDNISRIVKNTNVRNNGVRQQIINRLHDYTNRIKFLNKLGMNSSFGKIYNDLMKANEQSKKAILEKVVKILFDNGGENLRTILSSTDTLELFYINTMIVHYNASDYLTTELIRCDNKLYYNIVNIIYDNINTEHTTSIKKMIQNCINEIMGIREKCEYV